MTEKVFAFTIDTPCSCWLFKKKIIHDMWHELEDSWDELVISTLSLMMNSSFGWCCHSVTPLHLGTRLGQAMVLVMEAQPRPGPAQLEDRPKVRNQDYGEYKTLMSTFCTLTTACITSLQVLHCAQVWVGISWKHHIPRVANSSQL